MQRLDGLRALVTGTPSGLCEALARRLADDGASVHPVTAEVRDENGVRRAVAEAAAALGGLDALVNCAGAALDGPLSQTSLEDWQSLLDVDLTAPYLYSVSCLPLLREAGGGSIVHVASDVGVWCDARMGAYSVSSAALITLAQMLAVEAGPHGVTVNAVCPGAAGRAMTAHVSETAEHRADPEERLIPPVGRLATPEEIAGVVAFLIGPDARSVNGAALLVDGGMRAGYRAWSVQA